MLVLSLAILLAGAPASSAASRAAKPAAIPGKADPCTIVRIVDGDTADVLIKSKTERLRLLAIDTEESWPSASKPVTPFGLETSKWAKGFLSSEEPCWVEYGSERRDVYDRLLAYLWRQQDGEWRMYNLQSVERGYSPYFTKYGYSEQHHKAFVDAEKRAQKAKKGIWDPGMESDLRGKYQGPDGLRAWWDARADALKGFETIATTRPDIIDTRQNWERARANVGTRVTLFTAIRQAKEEGIWAGQCEGKLYEPLEIVPGSGPGVEEALRKTVGYYRYFSGTVELVEDGKKLRLTVDKVEDIALAPPPRAGATAAKKTD